MDTFGKYSEVIRDLEGTTAMPDALLMSTGPKGLSTYYAPFDYVNPTAKVVICGITPGLQQAVVALDAAARSLNSGDGSNDALREAKATASFAGVMRTNIALMLDHIGLDTLLGVRSCSELFTSRSDLVHYTSALRNPVFKNGSNYSGDQGMVNEPYLWDQTLMHLSQEISALKDAIWIPLGSSVAKVFEKLIRTGVIEDKYVLLGMPHASGANAERIKYFIGGKDKADLSNKVNPDMLDARKKNLINKISSLSR